MIDSDALHNSIVQFLKSREFDGPDRATPDPPAVLAAALVHLVQAHERRGSDR